MKLNTEMEMKVDVEVEAARRALEEDFPSIRVAACPALSREWADPAGCARLVSAPCIHGSRELAARRSPLARPAALSPKLNASSQMRL